MIEALGIAVVILSVVVVGLVAAVFALSRQVGKGYDEWDKFGLEAVEKARMTVSRITGTELEGWKAASKPVIDAWVETRTKAGDNGAELLRSAQDLMAKYAP